MDKKKNKQKIICYSLVNLVKNLHEKFIIIKRPSSITRKIKVQEKTVCIVMTIP